MVEAWLSLPIRPMYNSLIITLKKRSGHVRTGRIGRRTAPASHRGTACMHAVWPNTVFSTSKQGRSHGYMTLVTIICPALSYQQQTSNNNKQNIYTIL